MDTCLEAGRRILDIRRKAIAESLIAFSKKGKVERFAAYELVKHIPVMQLRRISQNFKRVDDNLSGLISYDELCSVLMQDLGIEIAAVAPVFAAVDLDESCGIDFREFAAACISVPQESLGSFNEVFDSTDIDDMTFQAAAGKLRQRAVGTAGDTVELVDWIAQMSGNLQSFEGSLRKSQLMTIKRSDD